MIDNTGHLSNADNCVSKGIVIYAHFTNETQYTWEHNQNITLRDGNNTLRTYMTFQNRNLLKRNRCPLRYYNVLKCGAAALRIETVRLK